MSAQQEDLDKTEQASAHKLEKAHARGSIVRSADVLFAVLLLVAFALLQSVGSTSLRDLGALLAEGIARAGRPPAETLGLLGHLGHLAAESVSILAPLLFVLWVAVTTTAALQARGVLTAEPLKPDFSRLSPATGFKRVFSIRALHELVRSFLKLAVFTAICVAWGQEQLPGLQRASFDAPGALAARSLQVIASLVALSAAVFVLFALIDYGFNRWEFLRRMRMSKKEVKDEHKEREGDPRIKSRLRELRLEWLKRSRAVSQVRNADVLVTNPTHYAVALEYRHGLMPAPAITARGTGELALRMRAEARKHRVPIVENPPLARALYALREEQRFVPEDHFVDVARILRWIYAGRAQLGARGSTR